MKTTYDIELPQELKKEIDNGQIIIHSNHQVNKSMVIIMGKFTNFNLTMLGYLHEVFEEGKTISRTGFLNATDNGLDLNQYVENAKNVTIVLKKNPNGDGYDILTSFPTNSPLKQINY